MGYAKDGREEIYETATNWQQGKTRFSINFVREAEKTILSPTLTASQKIRLFQTIQMVKSGDLIFDESEPVVDFLKDFERKEYHITAHG